MCACCIKRMWVVFAHASWKDPSNSWLSRVTEVPCYLWWAPGAMPEFMLMRRHNGPLKKFRVGAGQIELEVQHCDYKVEALSLVIPAWPLEIGGELEIEFSLVVNDSVNHSFVVTPQYKPWTQLRWTSWVVKHVNMPKGRCVLRTWKLHSWELKEVTKRVSSFHWPLGDAFVIKL